VQLKLLREAKNGNEKSKQKLIQTNLKFILTMSSRYKCKHMKTPDLIDEGVFGIIRAIDTFDEDKGVNFLSYAVWWIRLYMQRAIATKDNLISLPSSIIDTIKNELKIHDNINELNVDVYKFMKMKELGLSYDSLIANSDLTLSEILADGKSPNPEHAIKDRKLKNKLISLFLDILTSTERYVIENLFGLHGRKEITITKLSKVSKISPNTLKQLYTQAIQRIRSTSNFKASKEEYLDYCDTCECED
jgi:RNA polymerase sigma factor (sigma-70 family)